jgi:hypothetical protein
MASQQRRRGKQACGRWGGKSKHEASTNKQERREAKQDGEGLAARSSFAHLIDCCLLAVTILIRGEEVRLLYRHRRDLPTPCGSGAAVLDGSARGSSKRMSEVRYASACRSILSRACAVKSNNGSKLSNRIRSAPSGASATRKASTPGSGQEGAEGVDIGV